MAQGAHVSRVNGGSNSIRVEIYDQQYNLKGSDAAYVLKLAEYVDLKMRALAEQTNTVDSLRLAVLAALNIADEFHVLKRRYDNVASEYHERAHVLSDLLDEALGEKRLAG
jgi:cell division protein ZapA